MSQNVSFYLVLIMQTRNQFTNDNWKIIRIWSSIHIENSTHYLQCTYTSHASMTAHGNFHKWFFTRQTVKSFIKAISKTNCIFLVKIILEHIHRCHSQSNAIFRHWSDNADIEIRFAFINFLGFTMKFIMQWNSFLSRFLQSCDFSWQWQLGHRGVFEHNVN